MDNFLSGIVYCQLGRGGFYTNPVRKVFHARNAVLSKTPFLGGLLCPSHLFFLIAVCDLHTHHQVIVLIYVDAFFTMALDNLGYGCERAHTHTHSASARVLVVHFLATETVTGRRQDNISRKASNMQSPTPPYSYTYVVICDNKRKRCMLVVSLWYALDLPPIGLSSPLKKQNQSIAKVPALRISAAGLEENIAWPLRMSDLPVLDHVPYAIWNCDFPDPAPWRLCCILLHLVAS